MSLSIISEEKKQQEQEIQKQIFQAIDNYDDMIFNAGAGSGKTYALIESLKYIIEEKGERLNHHNQNVICITYTNVATNEIKDRLGNTTLVKVSTIHERLWDLIKDYQKQLVKIHKEKLQNELEIIKEELNTNNKFEKYREIADKDSFIQLMIEHKDDYYQNKDKSAVNFKESIKLFLDSTYHDLLKNVSSFKSLIGKIYKIKSYEKCLELINSDEYKEVVYDARYNTDRLHKMMISHDTILEYSLILINKYDMIKQIIIDKYPYILLDEYQDTNENVIKILNMLSEYAKHIRHNLLIGYFGDTAQNIYDTGVGAKIFEFHADLTNISKIYNRRSTNEIIHVINKVRNDDITQESIYNDADGGSVKFYQGTSDDIDSFIQKYKTQWNINQENKLHCLVLTNELVAKYNGFENIYTKLKSTPYYKTNWESINTEVLSNDLSKLGNIPILLYRIVEFKSQIDNPKTPIVDILNEKIYRKLTFKELKELIEIFKSLNNSSIKNFLVAIFAIYDTTENQNYKEVIKELIQLEEYSFDNFLGYMLNNLFPNANEEDIETSKVHLTELLEVELEEYTLWFEFINKIENKDVIYHTYHGTKGEEYDNVIIFMQNSFGKDKNKFSSYFSKCLDTSELSAEELIKFTNTKNLLYVSCSRAINNLRILYLDDISEFRSGVESIFDTTYQYLEED